MWRKVCLISGVLGGHLALLGWLQPGPDRLPATTPALRFKLAATAPPVQPTAPTLASAPRSNAARSVTNKPKTPSRVATQAQTGPVRAVATDTAVSTLATSLATGLGLADKTGETDLTRSTPKGALASVGTAPGVSAASPAVDLPSSNADYLNNPAPAYPALSRRLGEQGRVVIRVLIDQNGKPQQADIAQSSGHSRLDQAALRAVLNWRYVPGRRDGAAQDMWFNVPIQFALE